MGYTGAAKPVNKPDNVAPATGRTPMRIHPDGVVEPVRRGLAESLGQRSEQRLGFTARRAAILAGVICVLTLTIAGPVRTYFAQRTEMKQLTASQASLQRQIAELEVQKGKLADPAYIAAQARERLGFVKPGDIPFQVQLPAGSVGAARAGVESGTGGRADPWYTSLWHTIADKPHLAPASPPPAGAGDPAIPGVPGG